MFALNMRVFSDGAERLYHLMCGLLACHWPWSSSSWFCGTRKWLQASDFGGLIILRCVAVTRLLRDILEADTKTLMMHQAKERNPALQDDPEYNREFATDLKCKPCSSRGLYGPFRSKGWKTGLFGGGKMRSFDFAKFVSKPRSEGGPCRCFPGMLSFK